MMKANIGLLPPGRCRAFRLNAALMAASIDLVSQFSDISSVQPPSTPFGEAREPE
jgi:hypothetical protein